VQSQDENDTGKVTNVVYGVLNRVARNVRVVVIGFVCGAFLSLSAVAWATETESVEGYTAVVDGHQYGTYSVMANNEPGSPSDWAWTTMFTTDDAYVTAGWMGVDARKFKNGSVCEQTGYQYNKNSANWMLVTANNTACGSGTYYSYGVLAAWNGNGYAYYYSQKSPSLNG
jgi:hypothetical protein